MNKISEILKAKKSSEFATNAGTNMHAEMQRIIIDGENLRGNSDIIQKIKNNPKILPWFTKSARVEVPIAGKINGKIISRRIDRLIINDNLREIIFIDYKTDVNRETYSNKYKIQLNEYAKLLKNIYPEYKISGYILWLSDFEFDLICCLK